MLEGENIAEERFQALKELKAQIDNKENLIQNLQIKGEDFLLNSQEYFKYSSKVIVLTGICVLVMIALFVVLFILADQEIILTWNTKSMGLGFVFASLIVFVLIYSRKQKESLQQIARLNNRAAGWFDDVVSVNKQDIQKLKENYCSLATNLGYIAYFDETQKELINTQVVEYSQT